MSLHYTLGKANVVTDGLSRLSMGILTHVDKEKRELVRDVHHLANLRVCLFDSKYGSVIVQEVAKSSIGAEVKVKKVSNPILV